MKKGTLCRSSSEDECDLEEYCNGTSGECTPDLWVMDGHPCHRNTAFCYRGVCQTADKQCQDVFGRGEGAGLWEKGLAVLWETQRPGREALRWETLSAPAQTRLQVPASARVSPGVTESGCSGCSKWCCPAPGWTEALGQATSVVVCLQVPRTGPLTATKKLIAKGTEWDTAAPVRAVTSVASGSECRRTVPGCTIRTRAELGSV